MKFELPKPRASFVLVYGAITNRFREIGPRGGGNKASAAPLKSKRRPGQWRRSPTGKRAV